MELNKQQNQPLQESRLNWQSFGKIVWILVIVFATLFIGYIFGVMHEAKQIEATLLNGNISYCKDLTNRVWFEETKKSFDNNISDLIVLSETNN